MLFSFTFVSFQSAQLAGLDIMNIATGYLRLQSLKMGLAVHVGALIMVELA